MQKIVRCSNKHEGVRLENNFSINWVNTFTSSKTKSGCVTKFSLFESFSNIGEKSIQLFLELF